MNPDVAQIAVKPERTMIEAGEEAAVAVAGLRVKRLFITQCVPDVELKLRYPSNLSRIAKFYAGIVSVPEIITDNHLIIRKKRHLWIRWRSSLFCQDFIGKLTI